MKKQQTLYIGTNGCILAGTYNPKNLKVRRVPVKFNLFLPSTWRGYRDEEYLDEDYSNAKIEIGTASIKKI